MPTYTYKCTACENSQEMMASIKTYDTEHPACEACGGVCNYTYVPSVPYVSFIDGPSGSWVSKGERFKKHRQLASEAAARRQRERYGDMSKGAVPNYQGKEMESWREAQNEAIKDKGIEVAATFNSKIKEESSKLK
jgi:hypothetical protein